MLCGLKHLSYHARSPLVLEELCPQLCPQQPEKCLLIKVTWFPDSFISSSHSSPYKASTRCSLEKPVLSFVILEPHLPFPDSRIHLHPRQRSIGISLIFLTLMLPFLWEFLKRSGDKTQTLPSESSCPHKEDPGNSHSSLWVLLKQNNEILRPNCEFLKEPELCGLDTLYFI